MDLDDNSHDFTVLPDLAGRALGGCVVYANDELFAEAANLLRPTLPTFSTETFGHKGKLYDGWETRRRREPGFDYVIIRLGAGGIISGVLIDTMFFKGNYPPEASVEACGYEGYPSASDLETATWETIVPRSPIKGHFPNEFQVSSPRRFTHVRLTIYPDGGVARFRVFGHAQADPRVLPRTFDLVALENGGRVTRCSDEFYSPPVNLILPGRARTMGEGWENARRRGPGNDWVEFRLAAPGVVRIAEVDTSYFVGNSPGRIAISGRDERSADPDKWIDLVSERTVQPDTLHRFRVDYYEEVSHVRLDVIPDGGMARLRLLGEISDDIHDEVALSFYNNLTPAQAYRVGLAAGMGADASDGLANQRPLTEARDLPPSDPPPLSDPPRLDGVRMDIDDARARLAGHVHGVLCTLHSERGPDPQPVVYAVTDDGFLGVPIDKVKPKASTRLKREDNLAADPRATLLIEHWETADWTKLWWVRAELRHETDPPPSTIEELADRLSRAVPQYADRPFYRVLVCRIVGVTGWSGER